MTVPAAGGVMLAAALAIGVGARSVAQNLEPPDSIVVFAEKRPRPLQDVPMAVATLTGRDLDESGITDLEASTARLPMLGLQSSVSAVTTTLRIRRVGNLGNVPTFEPAVGLFVDGAYRSRSMLGVADLLDVERIEVLSGPQSTLYGKNTSAGVVAIYTREPGDVLNAIGEATVGSIEGPLSPALGRLEASVSGPLSSTWRGGIAGAYSWHGHTLANALRDGADGNEQSRSTFRGQLSWRPSDQVKLRLIAGYSRAAADEGESDLFFSPAARSTAVADSLRERGLTSGCPDNVPRNRISCATAANTLDLEAWDFTLVGEFELMNGWRLTSISGWDRYRDRRDDDDTMQLSVPLLYFHDSEEGTTLQEEVRLASSSAAATVPWLAGFFYYKNDYERGMRGKRPMFGPKGPAAFDPLWPSLLRVPLALPGQEGLMDSRLRTSYLSVFGQFTWNVGERLSVTTGARWRRDEKDATLDNTTTLPGASLISTVLTPTVAPNGEPVNGAVGRVFDGWTWSVTPAYRIGDGLMLYATWARGAKSGGFNTGFGNLPLSAREFGDERIDDYELGARASFGDKGRLGASVFYTRYRDYQDASFASAQFTIGNAARVDLKGAELEGLLALGARTSADLAISFADLTYARNTTGMCYPGRTPDGTAPGSCDLSGEHPLDAPEWAAHLGVERTRPLRSMQLFTRLDWSWTDRYNTSFSADPRLVQPPAHRVDLRLGLRFGDYEVVLAGENLLDEKIAYIDSVLNFFNDASYQSFLGDARRYSITFRAER